MPALANTPNYVFPALTVGPAPQLPAGVLPEHLERALRPQLDAWTRHDMKFGAEYLRWHDTGQWQLLSRGEFIFTRNPDRPRAPVPGRRLGRPDAMGRHRPRLDFVQRFDLNFGDWTIDIPRPTVALWFGDTWRMNNQLTVNYGVRWDADWGALDPPHVTIAGDVQPAGREPVPRHRPAAGRRSSIRAACATSTTSRRAAASTGTSAARATW